MSDPLQCIPFFRLKRFRRVLVGLVLLLLAMAGPFWPDTWPDNWPNAGPNNRPQAGWASPPEAELEPMVLPPNPRPKTTTPAAPASPHTEGDNLSKQGRGNARYGNAQSSGASTPASTVALQGSVSLDAAMVAEAGQVDWYRWYLSARQYLKSMGGLRCTEGTRIVFYRNGRIQALSQDPFCQISAMSKQFPLPQHTQVQAVVLPTRQSSRPPASPQELIDYVRQSSR